MIKTQKKTREPLFHIVKQDTLGWKKPLAVRSCAVLIALIVCSAIIVVFTKRNPLEVFQALVVGAIGTNGNGVMDLLQKAAILLCISLAVTPAFKMKFWNIGAEGQVLMGGLSAAACMIMLRGTVPNGLLIAIIFIIAKVVQSIVLIFGGLRS